MVPTPDVQAGHVQTVVRMQMRQQHLHGAGIRVALQRAEDAAAEVKDQRWGVRRPEQITRRGRIRTDHTTRAAEHGYSHGHYCAMPSSRMSKTLPHSVMRISTRT